MTTVIDHVMQPIRSLYPAAPVMAVGVSLGGIVLGNYLAGEGEAARELVDAALLVSVCFDTFRGTESIEQKGLNALLNRHLAHCLVSSIKEVPTINVSFSSLLLFPVNPLSQLLLGRLVSPGRH